MVVLKVVPVEVLLAPSARVGDVGERTWIVGLVLLGFELRLAERIVVAHSGARVT